MTLFNAMSRFNVQNLGNMAWAFATANQSDEMLITSLAKAAEQLGGLFGPFKGF